MNFWALIIATSLMSNLTLRGLLGELHLNRVEDFYLFCVILIIIPLFFWVGYSTSHDQKIVVLDFSAGLDVKLFV